jgi:hypothetical protein
VCKIMAIPGIKPNKQAEAYKFALAAAKYLTKADGDAFGFAALPYSGEVWGERWTRVSDAFNTGTISSPISQLLDAVTGTNTNHSSVYNKFGIRNEQIGAMILHARNATCEKTLANAHPFVRDNVAMIHNGVISNSRELTNITSTCDSEVILNEYIDYDVKDNPPNINEVTTTIAGWYAVMLLGRDTNNIPFLDVFRDSRASLFVAYIAELETVVYCTTMEIIQKTAKDCNFTIEAMRTFPNGQMIRINAHTNEQLARCLFNEKPMQPWNHLEAAPKHYDINKKLRQDALEHNIPEAELQEFLNDMRGAGLSAKELAEYRLDVVEMFKKNRR